MGLAKEADLLFLRSNPSLGGAPKQLISVERLRSCLPELGLRKQSYHLEEAECLEDPPPLFSPSPNQMPLVGLPELIGTAANYLEE